MEREPYFDSAREAQELHHVVQQLRAARDSILRDWISRARENVSVTTGDHLTDPLLLDHLPQLFDAVLDRLEINRPREDAEQYAAIHGFTRRIAGYDILETVIELAMFRHAIWAHITALGTPGRGAFTAMEQIDGLVDRVVIASLQAFINPSARMLLRKVPGGGEGNSGAPEGPADSLSRARAPREY